MDPWIYPPMSDTKPISDIRTWIYHGHPYPYPQQACIYS